MLNELSHARSQLIMNNKKVEMLAPVRPPIQIPPASIGRPVVSPDGSSYFVGQRMISGNLVVNLLPTSPTAVEWIAIYSRIQKEQAIVDWDGIYGDPLLGDSTKLRGGKLMVSPRAIIPDVNQVFIFYFALIQPNVDGVNLHPPILANN